MSNINAADIDALFPVAGQDNDSQGFRDNFDLIKTGLATAKTEITTLETTTCQGVSYSADDDENDFNGTKIKEANLIATTEEVVVTDTIEADQDINWANGHYQVVTLGDSVTLSLTGWPASGKMGKMRIGLKTSDGASKTVTWSASGGGTLKTNSSWPGSFTVTSQTDYIFVDFWTSNAGTLVFAQYHGLFD